MLRDDLQNALKTAMLAKDTLTTSAVRMIIAGQKEKDVEARGKGKEKATDEELMAMMQTMIKQRNDSIKMYVDGNRPELADKERAKRIVHQTFLRSSDEPEWVEALAKNDYSDFVDLVLENSKRLTFANTVEDAEVNGKLTSKALLIEATKKMNIEFNKLSQSNKMSKAIAKNFDLAYDVAKELNIKTTAYGVIGYYYLAYMCAINEELDVVELVEKLEDNSEFVKYSKSFRDS